MFSQAFSLRLRPLVADTPKGNAVNDFWSPDAEASGLENIQNPNEKIVHGVARRGVTT
jgi:hypothetical protein